MSDGFQTIKNQYGIKCHECKEIHVSFHRHDFSSCRCFRENNGTKGCFVDGGREYLRVGGDNTKFSYIRADWYVTEDSLRILAYKELSDDPTTNVSE